MTTSARQDTETSPAIGITPAASAASIPADVTSAPPRDPPAGRTMRGLSEAPPIAPRRRKPSRRGKWIRRGALMAVLVSAGVAAAIYQRPLTQLVKSFVSSEDHGDGANIQMYTARRGELRITLVEEGKLRAVNNYTIRMGVNGKITWLAEAGSRVQKGDRLASIDTKQYEDQIRLWESDLENQGKQLEIAEKQLPIAKSEGAAAVGNSETALATATLALKQYSTLDVPKKLNDMENAVNDARSKLADQQKKRQELRTQVDEMLSEDDAKKTLENNLALAVQTEATLKRGVTTAEDQRKLFRSYTYPQELASKDRAVANARLDVDKAHVTAENKFLSQQGEVARIKTSMSRLQSNMTQYKDTISKGTATAPASGLVFYGGPDLDRYGMSSDSIKVGADWYSSYPIMSIPDLSAFLVNFPVAEVYRGRVNMGMPATIKIDAIPGLILQGTMTTVSSVSRNKVQYDSTSPPVYDATLSLDTVDPRMVAGMTVQVEIVTAALQDVIFVPVEAVFNEEGKTAVFLWMQPEANGDGTKKAWIEKRPVLTGQSSDHFVQIVKGIREGDKLLLSRPTAFVTPRDYREQVEALFPPAATGATGPVPGVLKTEFLPTGPAATAPGAVHMGADGSVTVVPAAQTAPAAQASTAAAATKPAAASRP